MSMVALNGSSSSGTQYDFTNMTRRQAIAAGGELFKGGKLTQQEMASLQGFSLDSAPVSASGPTDPAYGLNSSVSRDYEALIKQDLSNNQALGSKQQKEVDADKDLLNVLSPYLSQHNAIASAAYRNDGSTGTQETSPILLGLLA